MFHASVPLVHTATYHMVPIFQTPDCGTRVILPFLLKSVPTPEASGKRPEGVRTPSKALTCIMHWITLSVIIYCYCVCLML